MNGIVNKIGIFVGGPILFLMLTVLVSNAFKDPYVLNPKCEIDAELRDVEAFKPGANMKTLKAMRYCNPELASEYVRRFYGEDEQLLFCVEAPPLCPKNVRRKFGFPN